MTTLQNKTILITGGTSRLGRAFVEKAVSAGGEVFFTYHQNSAQADALTKAGAEGFQLDLTDMKAIDELSKKIKAKTGHLDILIHNAAGVRDHTIQNLTEEDWDYVMNADLKAPYYLTKKLMPLLFGKKSKPLALSSPSPVGGIPLRGHALSGDPEKELDSRLRGNDIASKIFFITSRAAVNGGFGISNYAAAKAGLIGLAKSLAQELGKKKILVNALNPGFMISDMTKDLPQNVLDYHKEFSPISRYSDPEEVADFLVYLSSDAVTQMTGQVLHFESRKTS